MAEIMDAVIFRHLNFLMVQSFPLPKSNHNPLNIIPYFKLTLNALLIKIGLFAREIGLLHQEKLPETVLCQVKGI